MDSAGTVHAVVPNDAGLSKHGETTMTKNFLKLSRPAGIGLMALSSALGCSQGNSPEQGEGVPLGDGVFESGYPSPQSTSGTPPPGNNLSGDSSAQGPLSPTAGTGSEGGAARVIEEADIIKVEGGKLFALSQYGGLSVIDVSKRDDLRLLGRHKIVAMPFEMYVRQGLVFALYHGYGDYVFDAATKQTVWVQTSRVVVMDTLDPANIKVVSEFSVPGTIADSRIVGNILYVAAYEDGACWGCTTNQPRTVVVSLDVANPSQVTKVDEVSFAERTGTYSWKRSITVTDQRMYVAGPVWGPNEPIGSTVQVVDISDPKGDIKEGVSVQVAGQVNSRWQMDEYQSVLRVISQPFQWQANMPPQVETFQVASSTDVTPLGKTTLTLPRPEGLQSVRFDGARAYAITFEQTDPLFTIDLTDPAKPAQVGELEMPGWVYHMEPRGNRLIGLGFDQGNPEGSLHVSLFDVTNMAKPTMIVRRNFGGSWGGLAEGQDQIHKSFRVLDDAKLILVPFSGYTQNDQSAMYCGGTWNSGIQLLDWGNDTLGLRGVVPTKANARRGLLHDERLLAVSDDKVEAFDITNRDAPRATSSVALAQNVTRTVRVGDHVLRVSQNWQTQSTELDVTSLAAVTVPSSKPNLEIQQEVNTCYGGQWLADVFASGNRAYLVYRSYDYSAGKVAERTRLATVEVSPAGTVSILGQTDLPLGAGDGGSFYYGGYPGGFGSGLVSSGSNMVAVGSTLAFADTRVLYEGGKELLSQSAVKVVDMTDPKNAKVINVDLPGGNGLSGLLISGNIVARSHSEVAPFRSDRVRFFLDRIDISNPAAPRVLPSVNIPGSLVSFDAANNRIVTADYQPDTLRDVTMQECYGAHATASYTGAQDTYNAQGMRLTEGRGLCEITRQSLNLVQIFGSIASRLGRYDVPAKYRMGQITTGDDRVFAALDSAGYYGYGYGYGYGVSTGAVDSSCFGPCGYSTVVDRAVPLLTLGGLKSGVFSAGTVDVSVGDYGSIGTLVAAGQSAVFSAGWRGEVAVVSAENAALPKLIKKIEVPGYVQAIEVIGNTAVCALGYDGVATIPITK